MSKKCNICKIHKSRLEFYKNKKLSDGLQNRCKNCMKKYYEKNKERLLKYKKEYHKKNRKKALVLQKKYYEENKQSILEYQDSYRKENPGKVNAIKSRYRSSKLKATPKWLTQEHKNEIIQIYQDVQNIQWLSEEPLEVDHIVPLQGENVCGLHVPWNLQILTKSENASKRNSFG